VLKILWFTDVHCSNSASNIDNIHLNETISLFAQIRQYVMDNPVDIVIFGGDMFNDSTKIGTKVLTVLSEVISSLSTCVPIYMITGNHDTIEDTMKETVDVGDNGYFKFARSNLLYPFFKYESVVGIDKPVVYNLDKNLSLFFVPYCSNPTSHIKRLLTNTSNSNKFLFGHFDLTDMNYARINESVDGVDSKYLNDNFDLSFIGHIHEPMEKGNTIITGSSRNIDFTSISEEKYFYVIDTDKKTFERFANADTCIYKICQDSADLLMYIQNNGSEVISKTKILYRYKKLEEIKEILAIKKYFKQINFEKPISNENRKTLADVKQDILKDKFTLINKDNIKDFMLNFIDDKSEHSKYLEVFKTIMEAPDETKKDKK